MKKENLSSIVLYRCEVCGEPKIIEIDGKEESQYCKCEKKSIWENKHKKFKEISIFDSDSDSRLFENAKFINEKEKEFYKKFYDYCNKFEVAKQRGLGIMLLGNAGTGKTFATGCIYNKLKKRDYKMVSFNLGNYFKTILESDMKENKEIKLLKTIKECDVIFIDDLGSEKSSGEWHKEIIYNLVDGCYRAKIPMIISSNNTRSQLGIMFQFNGSEKIMDRLDERCRPFLFDWKSRRKDKNKDISEGIF